VQFLPFIQQLVLAFFMVGVGNATVHRANFDAFGLIEPADTFGAFGRVYFINRCSLFNSFVLAFCFAGAAADAVIGYYKSHFPETSKYYFKKQLSKTGHKDYTCFYISG
jgi:hypothetical protein